jgi:rubrerythrin
VPREEGVSVIGSSAATELLEGEDYVRFWATGERVKGEFHCSECGYGVAVHRELPACPMCASTSWEQAAWRPFTRTISSDL